jgi:hypothetical protein
MEIILTPEEVADRYTDGSLETLRRWRRTGEGPPFVQLSARRVGYRLTDCEAWSLARTFTNRADAVAVVPSLRRSVAPASSTRPASELEVNQQSKRPRRVATA